MNLELRLFLLIEKRQRGDSSEEFWVHLSVHKITFPFRALLIFYLFFPHHSVLPLGKEAQLFIYESFPESLPLQPPFPRVYLS